LALSALPRSARRTVIRLLDLTLEELAYFQLPVAVFMGVSCRVAKAWRMNTFYEHHHDSIRFTDRCFDRIVLNALIQPFQQPERVVGFFNTYRELYPVSKAVLCDIAAQYQHWVTARATTWGAPLVIAPAEQRRDRFVDPYFRRAEPAQIVVILHASEPARYLVAIGKDDRWHLEYKWRWPIQYNFYLFDREWGRMFVRVCPYFPFSARVCLNQHHWLANRMRAEGIHFRQCANAFLTCSDPARLQQLADSLTARDVERCAQKWLRAFTPFFTPTERRQAACHHRLFHAQVEYCDNAIFHRRAAVDALGARLFDANRTIGQPTKLATIFGRKVTKRYRGKLETIIEDLDRPNPVIRSYYRAGSVKQMSATISWSVLKPPPTTSPTSACPKPLPRCRSSGQPWPRSPTAISPASRTSSKPSSTAGNCAS
jgi:hypothetical protein